MFDYRNDPELVAVYSHTLERVKGMTVEQLVSERTELMKVLRRIKTTRLALMAAIIDERTK